MKLTRVTVTGADDSVDATDLIAIADDYPFVEFGILLSRNSEGRPRFPSIEWVSDLWAIPDHVRFAGHLCGHWVKDFLLGKIDKRARCRIFPAFDRLQINTHGYKHEVHPAPLLVLVDSLALLGIEVILQNDEKNCLLMDLLACRPSVSALFDMSHGAGILPKDWPKPRQGFRCGYAGGLSPDNLAEQLKQIEQAVGDGETWIDAETHLRSPDDSQFDLDKVRKFLEISSAYVPEELRKVAK